MNNDNPLISVIVPVYNVEKYLKKCVDSIINQTYENIEIFLVDDGSTDSSCTMCDELKKIDKRIKIIHKKNGGLSDARNAALKIFNGEYVTFIDSDDWIDSNYILYLYKLIKEYKADISICEILRVSESGNILNKVVQSSEEFVFNEKESLHELLKTQFFATSACGKLYSRKLFLNRYFPIGKLYEDIPINYDIFIDGVKSVFGAKGLYFYLTRENSITTAEFKPSRMDAIDFVEEAMEKVNLKYPEFKELTELRLFKVYFDILSVLDNGIESKKYYKLVNNKIKQYRVKVLLSKQSNSMLKKKAICSFLNYSMIQKIKKMRIKTKETRNNNNL